MIVVFGIALLAFNSALSAQEVRGVRPAVTEPIAARGGVLMVPLVADQAGNQWPSTMLVTFEGGEAVPAPIAWIDAAPARTRRGWTDDPTERVVRPIGPADDTSSAGTGSPYVLVPLPLDGDGRVALGTSLVDPDWRDIPTSIDPRHDETPPTQHLVMRAAPDRPDIQSPFEYWRWVLLADRLGQVAPPPGGSELEAMVARHFADLWRIGLGGLARHERSAALTCRDLLTRTGDDSGVPIALWVADPEAIATLLDMLLTGRRDPASRAEGALAWADARPSIVLWKTTESGRAVRLSIINRAYDASIARFEWSNVEDIPIAVELPAGSLTRVVVDRPPDPPPAPNISGRQTNAGAPPLRLQIMIDGNDHSVPIGPRLAVARPPGLVLAPLLPPVTLAEVQTGVLRLTANDRATWVTLRKLAGRWEVFIDCRRHAAAAGEDGEAVTVLIGSGDAGRSVHLTVPEVGDWQLIGTRSSSSLEVHRSSWADRWYARIVLPDEWLELFEGESTLMGFVRTHGDGLGIETGPGLGVPWRQTPSRLAVDLTEWE